MRLNKAKLQRLEALALDRVDTPERKARRASASAIAGDGMAFARWAYRQTAGSDLIVGPHHIAMQDTLQRVMDGEIRRLIINVPPGYTKTLFATQYMIARGLALNPKARFLHLSYSHSLALLNSSSARRIIKAKAYQDLWPMGMRDDTDSKAMWWTTAGGGVYATSSGGQVTGFRAGHMEPGWTGALLIDDPVKPDDAFSQVRREGVNDGFNETIKSRLAIEDTPLIVIMQRIHHNDLSGYLLRGGSGERWHHLCLPVIIDNAAPYPADYTHGTRIEHGLADGWLWPYKHNAKHLEALQAHRRTFEAQYMQAPRKFSAEGALWTEAMLSQARELMVSDDTRSRCVVGVDPAVTSEATSDETGIVVASAHGKTRYSVDGDYSGRYAPQGWARKAMQAVKEHDADAIVAEVNQGGDMVESTLRACGFKGRVIKVRASKGKYARAEPISAMYAQGQVAHRNDLYQLESQMLEYVPSSAAKSPDRLDAAVWALTELAPAGKQSGIFV